MGLFLHLVSQVVEHQFVVKLTVAEAVVPILALVPGERGVLVVA